MVTVLRNYITIKTNAKNSFLDTHLPGSAYRIRAKLVYFFVPDIKNGGIARGVETTVSLNGFPSFPPGVIMETGSVTLISLFLPILCGFQGYYIHRKWFLMSSRPRGTGETEVSHGDFL